VRTLALERLTEIADERQLARAERWQLERVRELVDEIERGGRRRTVGKAEIDALFDEAIGSARSRGGPASPAG